ncbi:hypothetical protein [Streptomyces olivaceoviridis]
MITPGRARSTPLKSKWTYSVPKALPPATAPVRICSPEAWRTYDFTGLRVRRVVRRTVEVSTA